MPNEYYDAPYLSEHEHTLLDHTGVPGVEQSGASVAGGSATKIGIATVIDNDSNWVTADLTGAVIVGTDLALHAGGLGLDVLTDGLYAITATGGFQWGATPPDGVGVKIGTTGTPFEAWLDLENYPAVQGFFLSPVVPLDDGVVITLDFYADGGDEVAPDVSTFAFIVCKIGALPA